MYNKINLMIPSFKRVDTLNKCIQSSLLKADMPDRVVFSICVNEQDKETLNFVFDLQKLYECKICFVIEETIQPNLSLYWNLLYDKTEFKDEYTLVSMIGDDMEFVTKGWDTAILEKINDHNGDAIVYCNDNFIAGEKLCVNLFTTRKIVKATKKPFMCELFHADMIDQVWYFVGKTTGILQYLPNVIIQHNHMMKKPSIDWDETFRRLKPVQGIYQNPQSRHLALSYATIASANLIDAGIGKWNVL